MAGATQIAVRYTRTPDGRGRPSLRGAGQTGGVCPYVKVGRMSRPTRYFFFDSSSPQSDHSEPATSYITSSLEWRVRKVRRRKVRA